MFSNLTGANFNFSITSYRVRQCTYSYFSAVSFTSTSHIIFLPKTLTAFLYKYRPNKVCQRWRNESFRNDNYQSVKIDGAGALLEMKKKVETEENTG